MTAFNLLGGRFGLRAFLNGSFEFDVGFPWLRSGIRRWDRGLGFNVGIYVGHAGCYIRYLNQRSADGNGREITVGGGLELAVGYGRSFNFSVVKAYVGIEIYAILEGNFTSKISGLPALPGSRGTSSRELSTRDGGLPDLDLKSLELRGIIGIVVRGSAELDVWVLHVRVRGACVRRIGNPSHLRPREPTGPRPVLLPLRDDLQRSLQSRLRLVQLYLRSKRPGHHGIPGRDRTMTRAEEPLPAPVNRWPCRSASRGTAP